MFLYWLTACRIACSPFLRSKALHHDYLLSNLHRFVTARYKISTINHQIKYLLEKITRGTFQLSWWITCRSIWLKFLLWAVTEPYLFFPPFCPFFFFSFLEYFIADLVKKGSCTILLRLPVVSGALLEIMCQIWMSAIHKAQRQTWKGFGKKLQEENLREITKKRGIHFQNSCRQPELRKKQAHSLNFTGC